MNIFISNFSVSPVLLLVLGFSAGLMSGFYGIGGGWLVTPILNLAGLPMPYAIGTSLVYIIVNSTLGTIKHSKYKNVIYSLSLTIGIASILGVMLGKNLIFYLEKLNIADTVIRYIYIFFLLFESIYMLIEKKLKFNSNTKDNKIKKIFPPIIKVKVNNDILKISFWKVLIIGILIGFLSSTMGVGGGFVLLPILIYIIKIPVNLAVGTSIFTTLITSLSGSVVYIMANHVDWRSLFFMIITTILGTTLGVNATQRVNSENLKFLFAIMVFFAAVSVFFKQISLNLLSNITIFSIAIFSSFIIIYIAYIRNRKIN